MNQYTKLMIEGEEELSGGGSHVFTIMGLGCIDLLIAATKEKPDVQNSSHAPITLTCEIYKKVTIRY